MTVARGYRQPMTAWVGGEDGGLDPGADGWAQITRDAARTSL